MVHSSLLQISRPPSTVLGIYVVFSMGVYHELLVAFSPKYTSSIIGSARPDHPWSCYEVPLLQTHLGLVAFTLLS